MVISFKFDFRSARFLKFLFCVVFLFCFQQKNKAQGAAFNFDGGDYVQVPSMAFGNNWTAEVWVNPINVGGLFWKTILGQSYWNGLSGFVIAIVSNSVFVEGPTGFHIQYPITANIWTHVAATYNNGIFALYVNGTLAGVQTGTYTNSPAPFFIGMRNNNNVSNNSSMVDGYVGNIDEVRLWSTTRSQCEIQQYMNCEIPTSAANLVANYHFNQCQSSAVLSLLNYLTPACSLLDDASGNSNSGTFTGVGLNLFGSSNWVSPGGVTTGSITPASASTSEIDVLGNGNSIVDGSAAPSATNHSDFNGATTRTFVIQNTGAQPLNVGTPVFTGTAASQFSITTLPASLIPALTGTTSFVVTFAPTSVGIKNATLTLYNLDCNEPFYDFAITATALPASALSFDGINDHVIRPIFSSITNSVTFQASVKLQSTPGSNRLIIYNGHTGNNGYGLIVQGITREVNVLFGSITNTPTGYFLALNQWTQLTLVIENGINQLFADGNLVFTLTATPLPPAAAGSFVIGANNTGGQLFPGSVDEVRLWSRTLNHCEIQTYLNTEIPTTAPGLLANYHFNQGIAAGSNTAVTSLVDAAGSNDGTLTNFSLLTGSISNWVNPGSVANGFTLTSPPTATLSLSGNGNNIPIGAVTSTLNNTNFGTNPSRTFSISNTSGTLNIGTISFSGANAAQFSVTTLPASSLTVGGTSFVILHTPSVVGTASAIVLIPSNDCTNPTYSFVITASTSPASALSFDGADDYVITPNLSSAITATSDITIEAWINPNAAGVVIDERGSTSLLTPWNASQIEVLTNSLVALRIWSSAPVTSVTLGPINFGTWNHVVLRYNHALGKLDGFLNGVSSNSFVSVIRESPITSGHNQHYGIGLGDWQNLGSGAYFEGKIDEVRIWNTVRTQCEIQTFMNAEITSTASGLVANYHFNQGVASGSNSPITTLIDAAGVNTGTLTSFASTGTVSNWVSPGSVANGFTLTSPPTATLSLSGYGNNIPIGTVTNTLNNTNFGTNTSSTFSISNTSGTLNIGTISFSGANAAQFSVTTLPASSLTVGGSSFVVLHTPSVVGTSSAIVNITSNDCTNPTYSFVITASTSPASALNFDGLDDGVTIATVLDPQVTNYSLECWFKINSNATRPTLIKHGASTGTGRSHLFIDQTLNTLTSATGGVFLHGTTTITPGQWYHAAYTWNGNTRRIYLNGILEATDTQTLEPSTGSNWRLGVNASNNFLDGALDELRFWSTERTQCEIQTFMNCEIPTSAAGLVANYHFNQGLASGNNTVVTTLADASGNSNTGSLTNFALTSGTLSNWVSPGAIANDFTTAIAPSSSISLSGNGNSVPMGVVTSTINNTNFGTNSSRTFSISNTSGTLNIGTIYFTGPNAAQFSITTLPASSLTTGGSSFVITLTPTNTGISTATVLIPSNDCANPNFSFVITASTSPASALYFDGAGDRVNVLDINPATIPVMTFEAWVYRTGGSGVQTIIGNDNGGWDRCLVVNNGSVQVWAGRNIPTGFTSSLNTWEHYAVTWSPSEVRCIKNGTQVFVTSGQSASSSSLTGSIGGMIAAWAFPFIGLIDEARIWNVARTQCEVQTYMNAEIPTSIPGLIVNYHFNQGLPAGNNTLITSVTDATGLNTGTLSGFASTGTISNWVAPGAISNDFTTTSTPVVEINVTGNGSTIVDGDTSPSLLDWTDFGSAPTRTFIAHNTIAGGTLSIGTPFLSGANAGDFSVTALPSSSIVATGATNFEITFNPSSAGTKTAMVTIISSDCDEPIYDFVVRGTATVGAAMDFDGIDDVVDCGSLPNLDITSGTWEAWVNLSTLATNSRIFFKENFDGGGSGTYESFFLASSGKFHGDLKIGATNYTVASTTSPAINTWYHLALTHDGLNFKLYVNGILEGTNSTAVGLMNPGTGKLSIGASITNPLTSGTTGKLDEVRLWNRALCQNEIQAQMNCELSGTETGLVMYYKFNLGIAPGTNTTITTITDVAGGDNNGILSNLGLTGITSNFISQGGVISGSTCAPYTAPEIDILGNSLSITNGATATSTNNFTDFGTAFTRSFSIQNTGSSALNITTPITLSGADASQFTISSQPASSVPASGTTSFVVSFIPSSLGTKTAQINLINSDCDESPYTFVVLGTPTAAAALNFDGTNDYATCGNILTASYTKEAWVKIGASANGNNFLSAGGGITGSAFWAPGLPGYLYKLSAGHEGNWNQVQDINALVFGTWYHVAVTYDAPSTTMNLYKNGVLVATNNNVLPFTGTNPLQIGAFAGNFTMNGSIDEVRIWNRPLCPSEILNNMNCEIPTIGNGLLANYHFNQGVAFGNNTAITTITDVSGNNNNAALTNINSVGLTSNWEAPGAVTTGSACSVINVAEINIVGNGLSINDGDNSPSLTDHSNFGGVCIGNSIVRTFTIQNAGSAPLTVSSITMSGLDAASYLVGNLTPASPINASNSAVFTVTFLPSSAGIKSATIDITNNDCNESPYNFAITATCNALPVVGINVSQSVVCQGFSTALSGTGADTYTWNNGVTNAVAFSPTITQTYSVSGTSILTGCTSTNVVAQTITVNPIPTVTAGISSPSICSTGSITLSAGGASTYTWNPNAPTGTAFAPASTTSYSLAGTSSANCTSTNNAVVTIQVFTLPTVSINSGTLCTGQSFILLPSGATSYTYLNGGPVVNPLVNTTYSVIGSFSTGCTSASAAISAVTVYITPTISVNSGAICIGQSFTMVPTGALNYVFSSGSNTVAPIVTSAYTVNGTSSEGCSNVTPAICDVTVHLLPTVSASVSQSIICSGANVTLNGNGASTYVWSNGVPDNTAFQPSVTASYTVTGTDINGCENQGSTSVTVNALPSLSVASANTLTCLGETTTLTASGANTFTWNTGAETASIVITLSNTTTFSVSGTNSDLCSTTFTYVQLVDPCAGIVDVSQTTKDVTCRDKGDGEINFTTEISYSQKEVYYVWTPSELCPDSSCSSVKNLKGGNYSVKVKLHYTLTPTYSISETRAFDISVLDENPSCPTTIFNALRINNDGVNETFYVENIELYPNNKVTIFNRWGTKLSEIEHYDNVTRSWPSADELNKLSSATYYYIIDFGDGTELKKGWIEVVRN